MKVMDLHKGFPTHSTLQNPQPSQGVKLDAAEHGLVPANLQASEFLSVKKDPLMNIMESSQGTTHTLQPIQSHPKKKGGFAITSVKDNVDGDESADDLDESHTSYSEMSYSRTTDVDHDQESSASEDTLNTTVQDGMQQLASSQTSVVVGLTSTGPDVKQTPTKNRLESNHEHSNDRQKEVLLQNFASVHSQDSSSFADFSGGGPQPHASQQSYSTNTTTKSSAATPLGLTGVQPQTVSTRASSAASTSGTKIIMSTASSCSGVTTTKSTSVTSGAVTKGGRVYKVVKRETFHPVKKERSRWVCYDYIDTQSPNLGFVLHSSSDSRLNYHELQQHPHPNSVPMSMSATSVQSSASSYSLQHSDSSSSVYRDSYSVAAPVVSVQHSASTSSVNCDLDNRKSQRAPNVNAPGDNADNMTRRRSREERSEFSDSEAIKSAFLSVEANIAEDENASSRTFRIDNKIEAAMDLVKKHLMLAVRDEVDELKERIVELKDENWKTKKENEILKSLLTSEQAAQAQQLLSKQQTKSHPLQKSASMQQSQVPAVGLLASYAALHDVGLGNLSMPPLPQTSVSLSSQLPQGYAVPQQQQIASNTSGNIQMQQVPVNTNTVMSQGNPQPNHHLPSALAGAQQPSHLVQVPMTGQTAAQQQPPAVARQPNPATFPLLQSAYQGLPPPPPQQAQLTPQQIQAMRQQQGFAQAPASVPGQPAPAPVQPVFQAPVGIQQTVTNPPPSSMQPIQGQYPGQQTQPTSFAAPIQSHAAFSQAPGAALPLGSGAQLPPAHVMARQQHPPAHSAVSGVTSPTNSVPPTQPQTHHVHHSVTPTHATVAGSANTSFTQQQNTGLPHSTPS